MASLGSAHRLSQPPGGLLRTPASRACFIPQATSRVPSRPGASLSAQPFQPHRLVTTPMPLPPARSPAETGCHSRTPRLRGFAPHEAAFLRFGVNRPAARSPRRVRASSRSKLPPSAPVPRCLPLMTLTLEIFACALVSQARLQRLISGNVRPSVSGRTNLPEAFEPSFPELAPKVD